MPIITTNELHQHKYTERTYAPNLPGLKDKHNDEFTGQIKYFLFRKCKCGDKYTYDLTAEKPTK